MRVETDAGITGIGEVDSNPMAVKGAIEGPFSHTTACGLAQVVIGEDPFETEKLWHKMYRANIYGGRRGVGVHAMSGIDMALWDIKGKALGPAGVETAGRRFSPEDALLRQFAVRRHAQENRRAGAPLSRPGIHRGQVRLGPHGPGREDRHRAGARRRARDWATMPTCSSTPAWSGIPRPPCSARARFPTTTSTGSKSRCAPTITMATASSPKPRTCASRRERRRASASRSSI